MDCTVPQSTSSQTDTSFPSLHYEKLHDFTFHSFIFKIFVPHDRHSNQMQSTVYSCTSSCAPLLIFKPVPQFPFCGLVMSTEYIISMILWIKHNFTENGEGWIKESRNHLQQMVEIYNAVKAATHITTDFHLLSHLGFQVSTRNTTVKTSETSKIIHSLSQRSKNQWNICCRTNWHLFLLHTSSRHVRITFPQMAMLSARKPHISLLFLDALSHLCFIYN